MHAGVAFIVEHDLQLYSRRAKFWENNLGDARYYQEQLAGALGCDASDRNLLNKRV